MSKNLFLLSQLKHFVDTSKRKLFYHSHIPSDLTYVSTVWVVCSTQTKLIKQAKASHFHAKLEDAATDSKKKNSLLSTLLNRENRSDFLPDMIHQEAAKSFSRFFQEKIETIRQEFNDDPLDTTENFASSVHSSDMLSSFYALSEDQILKLIRESKSTTATVDPAPTKLVLEFTDVLLPVFQKIVNLSLTSGTVPIAFKKAVVKPLI